MLPLQAITIFPCLCPGLDASPPASTHELTIPNDVSKSKRFLSLCVCMYTYICVCMNTYIYIYKLQAYDFIKRVSRCPLTKVHPVQSVGAQLAAQRTRWALPHW